MEALPYKGAAILMPFNGELHLFAILNSPCLQGLCLVAMITTIYADRFFDETCVLDKGDHPFLNHKSYVLFSKVQQIPARHIRKMLDGKVYFEKQAFSEMVFEKIANGLFDSDETPMWALKYAKAEKI